MVTRILEKVGTDVRSLIGDTATLTKLRPDDFVDETFGRPTVVDIISELDKPGRDPRPEFKTATFASGIEKVSDLEPGMILEGQVTNVAAFGAFVDVGVHQDGLVHVSAMARRFVSDPHEIVKSGDIVKVKVMEVDVERQRIGLSCASTTSRARPARAGHARPAEKETAAAVRDAATTSAVVTRVGAATATTVARLPAARWPTRSSARVSATDAPDPTNRGTGSRTRAHRVATSGPTRDLPSATE